MREMLLEAEEVGLYGSCRYYITVDELSIGGDFYCESYGIAATRANGADRTEVRNITPSQAEIQRLAKRVAAGRVSPETLFDVIVDLIS